MSDIIIMIQLAVSVIMGVYFYSMIRSRRSNRQSMQLESKKQVQRL
jgi:hypothetical protein